MLHTHRKFHCIKLNGMPEPKLILFITLKYSKTVLITWESIKKYKYTKPPKVDTKIN